MAAGPAYPGVYERNYPGVGSVRVGPGWHQYGYGSSRVGPAHFYRPNPPVPRRPAAAAARPGAAPGAAPGPAGWPGGKPPPGTYNPEHDFALEQARREGYSTEAGMPEGYAEEGADVKRERGEHDYYTRLGQIGEREARQRQDSGTALDALRRSFANLATSQTGNANRAGVLQGGALLASAAARAGNQQRGETGINTQLERNVADNKEARDLLAQEWGPSPVAGASWEQLAAGGGGRHLQDLATEVLHGRGQQVQFEKNTPIGEAAEAAQLGYEPPAAKAKAAVRRHAARHRGRR